MPVEEPGSTMILQELWNLAFANSIHGFEIWLVSSTSIIQHLNKHCVIEISTTLFVFRGRFFRAIETSGMVSKVGSDSDNKHLPKCKGSEPN